MAEAADYGNDRQHRMTPTAAMMVVLVGAFLLGVKFIVDLIKHGRR
jgi:hypothetical protein